MSEAHTPQPGEGKPEAQPMSLEQQSQPQNVQIQAGDEAAQGDAPFAIIGDQSFSSQADLTKWWDEQRNGADSVSAGGDSQGGDSASGTGEDSLKGGEANDAVGERTDEEIIASLKEAGGIYAEDRYQPFALEFEKTGTLSEESISKAAQVYGISKEFVQAFVEGQKAQRQVATQPTAEMVALSGALSAIVPDGDEYGKVLEWGREHVSKDLQEAYNAALDRHDAVTAGALLKGFYGDYKAAGNGAGPRDVTEEGRSSSGSLEEAAFQSAAEMEKAMNDPRYATDEAYRQRVARRLGKSNF